MSKRELGGRPDWVESVQERSVRPEWLTRFWALLTREHFSYLDVFIIVTLGPVVIDVLDKWVW